MVKAISDPYPIHLHTYLPMPPEIGETPIGQGN